MYVPPLENSMMMSSIQNIILQGLKVQQDSANTIPEGNMKRFKAMNNPSAINDKGADMMTNPVL